MQRMKLRYEVDSLPAENGVVLPTLVANSAIV